MGLSLFLILLVSAASVTPFSVSSPYTTFSAVGYAANIPPAGAVKDAPFLAAMAPLVKANMAPNDSFLAEVNLPAAKARKNTADKNQTSALAMDALCANILGTYVNNEGLVDYKTLRRKRIELISVLTEFASLDPNSYARWSKADKLAFWINAYNMCTLKGVVDNYPIQPSRFKIFFYPPNSVMQISQFWEKADYTIMGENYSLHEIENKIIRGQFNEPRVCVALSYASLGCAPLRREPYYGRDLDKQLDDQARIFLATDRGMKIDRDARVVYLAAVFQWYENEFFLKYPPINAFGDQDATVGAILTYISGQISKKDSDWLLRKMFTVTYLKYNWVLNEQL